MRNDFPRPVRLFVMTGFVLVCWAAAALADAPAGYYDSVDASSATNLRQTLNAVIDDHTYIPYTASVTDTWDVLEAASEYPNDPSRILDVYLNASYPKWNTGNNDYDREHTWPKSYGFPDEGSDNYPYNDCHQLYLCDGSRNSSRGNKPFDSVGGAGTTEYPTLINDGVGGGTGVYPGWSCWANPVYWEVWWDRRGDIARAMFYMDVRYEGGTHGVTGQPEPELILTDNLSLIEASNTGSNISVAYMGLLSTLLQWHQDDPVDEKERIRNDVVFAYQGNRNPFADHPEWVDCLFGGACGGVDVTPPAIPTGLAASPSDGGVWLNWDDNGDLDLDGYTVYRATTSGGPYSPVGGGLVDVSQYQDTGLTNGTTYYYVITASDFTGNESDPSAQAEATPQAGGTGGGPVAWINEFHYDNDGTDTGEFFEIAGTAGLDLTGWTLYGYNGNGGILYDTEPLSGILPDQQSGFGTLSFVMVGMQNGSPDGLALVDGQGAVVEFISYEGSITANDGPAVGMTSTDIGVAEDGATPIGFSLQLIGTGAVSSDFTWTAPMTQTPGQPNTGQTFFSTSPVPDVLTVPGVAIVSAYPNPFNPTTTIRWSLRDAGPVRVEIFSVRGELVRTLVAGSYGAGEHAAVWDGRADDGRTAPSGAYYCRLTGNGGMDTRGLLMLK